MTNLRLNYATANKLFALLPLELPSACRHRLCRVPQVLAMGDSLLSKGEFDLAKQACFEFVLDANLLE